MICEQAADYDGKSARGTVLGAAAVIVSAALPPFLVGALAPRIATDLPFDTSEVGLAVAAYYAASGVLSPLGGRIVELIGVTAALRLTAAISAIGLAAIAVATQTIHVFLVLALLGLPNSLAQPASNNILSRVAHRKTRGLAFGVVQASIPFATLVAGMFLAVASFGNRWRLIVFFVAGCVVLVQFLVPRAPNPISKPDNNRRPPEPSQGSPNMAGAHRMLTALVATGFLASAAATSLPSFAATTGLNIGVAPVAVAGAQMAGSLGSILVRISAPAVVSHLNLKKQLQVVSILLLVGVFGFLGLASQQALGFGIGIVTAFAFGWGWNGLFNLAVAGVRPNRVASSTGFTQAGVFLGGMTGPLVFAFIANEEGDTVAWCCMAIFMCVACGTILSASKFLTQNPVGVATHLTPTKSLEKDPNET